MAGHRLEIVKPGRGVWLAGCSCGAHYRAPSGRLGHWTPSEVSEAAIRVMHREHKAGLR